MPSLVDTEVVMRSLKWPSLRPGKSSPAPDEVYRSLRDTLLGLVPADVRLAPTPEAPRVWGVLFEMGMRSGTATIVALADGTASLYTSTGGGVIGGGSREGVAAAARRCVQEADSALEAFPRVEDVPLPTDGRSALVILAYEGVRRVEADDSVLAMTGGAIGTVYSAAHGVITELRQIPPPRAQG